MKKPTNIFKLIRTNFFLRRHVPQSSTMRLLHDIYPTINWNRVNFYEGLPWFTPMVAPYVTCQALPRFYSAGGFSIYLSKYDESRGQCLADIVHEAFHIMQAMTFGRGYGLGFFRGFMVHYIAVFLKHGYRQNPFEVPAYDQEFRFLQYCESRGLHGMVPGIPPGALHDVGHEAPLVFRKFKYKYQGNFLWLCASFVICILVTVIKPIADLFAFLMRFLVPSRHQPPVVPG